MAEETFNNETTDQIASVMLQHGTAEQQAQALDYASNGGARANKRYDEHHPHGRPLDPHSVSPVLSGADGAPLTKVAAVALINAAGQILVGYNQKRAVWDVPQGVVEDGELPVETAVRELQEETGVSVLFDDLESIALFRHKTPEFIYPWETSLFLAVCDNSIAARNMEPDKCDRLMWCAPFQLPQPRGLSLRVLLTLLGRE